MADQFSDWDNSDDDNEGSEPKPKNGLRAQLEQVLAAKKELEQELATLRSEKRQQSLQATLSAAGVNPKVAKFIPSDVEGDENIAAWLAEYADVFGIQSNTDGGSRLPAGATAEQVDAARGLQNLSNVAVNPAKLADFSAQLKAAKTPAEFEAVRQQISQYGM